MLVGVASSCTGSADRSASLVGDEAMRVIVPTRLAAVCRSRPEWADWLERLPALVLELQRRWALTLDSPFDTHEMSSAWVAPVTRADGTPAALKIGIPHMEARQELAGLRFWNGDPTVLLLDAEEAVNAMLLERCVPGSALRALAEPDQGAVIATLLKRLWRIPPEPHPFRPLAEMIAYWSEETIKDTSRWADAGLIGDGLRVFGELLASSDTAVLLATDLHAGNVLQAQREPWLVVDPKPFVGDPAYDATQHLFNCRSRLRSDPATLISRLADLLEVDPERVRLWAFARAAAEPRSDWKDPELIALARVLSY